MNWPAPNAKDIIVTRLYSAAAPLLPSIPQAVIVKATVDFFNTIEALDFEYLPSLLRTTLGDQIRGRYTAEWQRDEALKKLNEAEQHIIWLQQHSTMLTLEGLIRGK